jgi:hypothetical protein
MALISANSPPPKRKLRIYNVTVFISIPDENALLKTKLRGLSPRANYTERETAACRQSYCQLLRLDGATWSKWRIPTAVFSAF